MPRRTPRSPSIGFASCKRFTAAKIALSRGVIVEFNASAVAISALRVARSGKNSWSGGSNNLTVTGYPDIALRIPTKSACCSGSISAMTAFCSASFSANTTRST